MKTKAANPLKRSVLRQAALLSLASILVDPLSTASAATSASWTGLGDSNWNTSANWTGGVTPNGAGDTALFDGDSSTMAGKSIVLNGSTTLGILQISGGTPDSGASFSIASNNFIFNNGGAGAQLSLTGNRSVSIASGITMQDNLTITNSSQYGGVITLTGAISTGGKSLSLGMSSLGSRVELKGTISGSLPSLTIEGAGTLLLSGSNNFSGTTIYFKSGIIELGSSSAFGNSGNTIQMVDTGGTLKMFDIASGNRSISNSFLINDDFAVTSRNTGNTLTLSGSMSLSDVHTIEVDNYTNLYLSGYAYGTGGIIKKGLGTLYMNSSANSFTGELSIIGGTAITPGTTYIGGTSYSYLGRGDVNVRGEGTLLNIGTAGTNILSLYGKTLSITSGGVVKAGALSLYGGTLTGDTSGKLQVTSTVTFSDSATISGGLQILLDSGLTVNGSTAAGSDFSLIKRNTGTVTFGTNASINLTDLRFATDAYQTSAGIINMGATASVQTNWLTFADTGTLIFGKNDQITGATLRILADTVVPYATTTATLDTRGYSQTFANGTMEADTKLIVTGWGNTAGSASARAVDLTWDDITQKIIFTQDPSGLNLANTVFTGVSNQVVVNPVSGGYELRPVYASAGDTVAWRGFGSSTQYWNVPDAWTLGVPNNAGINLLFDSSSPRSTIYLNSLGWTIGNLTNTGLGSSIYSSGTIIFNSGTLGTASQWTDTPTSASNGVSITSNANVILKNDLYVTGTASNSGIDTIVSESGGSYGITINKTGGFFNLSGSSSFSGGVNLQAGTLRVQSSSTSLGTGTLTIGNGTTIDAYGYVSPTFSNKLVIEGDFTSTNSYTTGYSLTFNYSGTVDLTKTHKITVNNHTLTFSANTALVGAGGIEKQGSYALQLLSANNTFSGGLSIQAGTVTTQLTSDLLIGSPAGGSFSGDNYLGAGTVTNKGTLNIYSNGNNTYITNTLTNDGSIYVYGGGSTYFDSGATYLSTGTTTAKILYTQGSLYFGSATVNSRPSLTFVTAQNANYDLSSDNDLAIYYLSKTGNGTLNVGVPNLNASSYINVTANGTNMVSVMNLGTSNVTTSSYISATGSASVSNPKSELNLGSGTVTANSYIQASAIGAVVNFQTATVKTGYVEAVAAGVLSLGRSDAITNVAGTGLANLYLSGGTLQMNGFSQAFGQLRLSDNSSVILGAGANKVLLSLDSKSLTANKSLFIMNSSGIWDSADNGTSDTSTYDYLRFKSGTTFSATELAQFHFVGYEDSQTLVKDFGGTNWVVLTPKGDPVSEWVGWNDTHVVGTGGDNKWTSPANWFADMVPNAVGAVGLIGNADPYLMDPDGTITGDEKVILVDAAVTIGRLSINTNQGQNFLINDEGDGTGITFNNNGSDATLNIRGNAKVDFGSKIHLADNLILNIDNTTTPYSLIIDGIISGDASKGITKTGNGAFQIGKNWQELNNTFDGNFTWQDGAITLSATGSVFGQGGLVVSGTGTRTLTTDTGTGVSVARNITSPLILDGNLQVTSTNSTGVDLVFLDGGFGNAQITSGTKNVTANSYTRLRIMQNIVDADINNPGALNLYASNSSYFMGFYGNNTYSGGTTLNAGYYIVGNDNAFGTGDLNIGGNTVYLGALNTTGTATSVSLHNRLVFKSGSVLYQNTGGILNFDYQDPTGVKTSTVEGGYRTIYSFSQTNQLIFNTTITDGASAGGILLHGDSTWVRFEGNNTFSTGFSFTSNYRSVALVGVDEQLNPDGTVKSGAFGTGTIRAYTSTSYLNTIFAYNADRTISNQFISGSTSGIALRFSAMSEVTAVDGNINNIAVDPANPASSITLAYQGAFPTGSGQTYLGVDNGTLKNNGVSTTIPFTLILESGLTLGGAGYIQKYGSGTLEMRNANSTFSGGMQVAGGTVIAGNQTSDITIGMAGSGNYLGTGQLSFLSNANVILRPQAGGIVDMRGDVGMELSSSAYGIEITGDNVTTYLGRNGTDLYLGRAVTTATSFGAFKTTGTNSSIVKEGTGKMSARAYITTPSLVVKGGLVEMGYLNLMAGVGGLTLDGGNFSTGGYTQTLATSAALNLLQSATLDFGNAVSLFTVGSLGLDATGHYLGDSDRMLTLLNWTGNATIGRGTDQFLVNSGIAPGDRIYNIDFGTGYMPGARVFLNANNKLELLPLGISYIWTASTTPSEWANSNWDMPGYPAVAGDGATFADLDSTINGKTIQVSQIGATMGYIFFKTTSAANFSLAGGTITLNTGDPNLPAGINVTGASSPTIKAGLNIITGGSLEILHNGTGTLALDGQISGGSASIVKSGSGTVAFNNATSSYTHGTTLNNGTLQFGADSVMLANYVLSSGPLGIGRLTINGGNLSAGSSPRTIGNAIQINTGFSVTGDLTLSGSTGNTAILGNDATLTMANATDRLTIDNHFDGEGFSGNYTITKAGLGTLVLTGSNQYAGTNINAGTVEIWRSDSLSASSSAVQFTGSATLRIAADTLSLGHAVSVANSAVAAIDTQAYATLLSGVVSGAGALAKQGSGTLTLSGVNTYAGGTAISAGTVVGTNVSALGSGAIAMSGNTNLDLIFNNGNFTNSITGNNTTVLDITGTGNRLSGNNSGFAGTINVDGTLNAAAKQNIGTGTINLGDSTLTLDGTDGSAFNFTNTLTGSADSELAISLTGTGAQFNFGSAVGTNFLGTTRINAGNLLLNGNAAAVLTPGQLVQVNTSGIVTVDGTAQQQVSNLDLNGGTLIFDPVVQNLNNTLGTILTEDLSLASGKIQINTGTIAPTMGPLLREDDGNRYLLIQATGTVGAFGNIQLVDGSGNDASTNYTNRDIQNDAAAHVVGYYGYGLSTGPDNDGLYLTSGLQVLDIQMGTLILSGDTTAAPAGGDDMTAKITGVGSLQIDATNSILLTGPNDYTGATTVNTGTLKVGTSSQIFAASSAMDVKSGAGLDLNGHSQQVNALTGSGVIVSNVAGAIVLRANNASSADSTFTGSIGSTGVGTISLEKTGTGTLTLSAASPNLTGATVTGGTLKLTHTGAVGANAITNNATLELAATGGTFSNAINNGSSAIVNVTAANITLASTVTGGTVNISGSGAIITSTTNTPAAWDIKNTGSATITTASNLGSTGTVNVAGTLNINASLAYNFANVLTGTGTIQATTGSPSAEFSFGDSVGSGYQGTLILGPSLFTLGNSASHQNTAALTNATLQLGNGTAAVWNAGNMTTVATGQQNVGNVTFAAGATTTFDITGTGASAQGWINTGTLALNGGNIQINTAAYTGNSTGGLLVQDEGSSKLLVKAASITGSASNLVLIDSTGTAIASGSLTMLWLGTDIAKAYYGSADGTSGIGLNAKADGLYIDAGLQRVDIQSGKTLVLDGDTGAVDSASAEFHAQIIGAGNLQINATNTITLNNHPTLGTNTYSGRTLVTGGTLKLGANNVLGNTSELNLAAGTTVNVNNTTQTVGLYNDVAGATLAFGNGGTALLTVKNGGTVHGAITGAGTLALSEAGTLQIDRSTGTVSSNVKFTFGTTGSVLELNGGTAGNFANKLGSTVAGAGKLSLTNGANITLTGDNSTTNGIGGFSGIFDIAYGTTLTASDASNLGTAAIQDNGAFIINTATNWALAQVISGTGTFTKLGTGTLTLSGLNTYTGDTVVSGGVLQISADSNLGADGMGSYSRLVFNGGTLKLGASFNFNSSRLITINATGGTIDTAAFSTTIAQGITGGTNGTLTKLGSGVITLTGNSTYNGETIIRAGTVRISGSGALSNTSRVDVTNAGTFEIAVAGTNYSLTNVMKGTAGGTLAISLDDEKTFSFTNSNDTQAGVNGEQFDGTVEVRSGTVILDGTSTTFLNAGTGAGASITAGFNGALRGLIDLADNNGNAWIIRNTFTFDGGAVQWDFDDQNKALATFTADKIVIGGNHTNLIVNIQNDLTTIDESNLNGISLFTAEVSGHPMMLATSLTSFTGSTATLDLKLLKNGVEQTGINNITQLIDQTGGVAEGVFDWAPYHDATAGTLNVGYILKSLKIYKDKTLDLVRAPTDDNNRFDAAIADFDNSQGDPTKSGLIGSGSLRLIDRNADGHGIVFASTSTYTGSTTIAQNTLVTMGANNAIGTTSALNIGETSTDTSSVRLAGTSQTTGTLSILENATLDFGSNTASNLTVKTGGTVQGDIIGTAGKLTLSDTGTLQIQRSTETLSGNINIAFGKATSVLELNGGTAGNFANVLGGSGKLALTNGAVITLTGDNSTANALGGFSGTFDIGSGTTLKVSQDINLGGGSLSGGGIFEKIDGTTTVTINQANTAFTGTTTVTAGTLELGNRQAVGSGTITNLATLDLTFASGSFGNAITNTGGIVNVDGDNITLAGAITGGTVNISGSGTSITSLGNTPTQWNVLAGGSASATAAGNLGTGAINLAAASGSDAAGLLSLNVTGGYTLSNALTGGGVLSVVTNASTNEFKFTGNAVSSGFAGTLKLGTATFNLGGDNTTALTNATLQLDAGSKTNILAGNQAIGNLTFNGGDLITSLIGNSILGFITVNTLDVTNGGTVTLNITDTLAPGDIPNQPNFLDQDGAGSVITRIVTATNTTIPGTTPAHIGLKLMKDGSEYTGSTRDISFSDASGVYVIATYGNIALVDTAGIYLTYGLTRLDIQNGKTLTLNGTNTSSGTDATLSAQIVDTTGNGHLIIDASSIAGNTITLANAGTGTAANNFVSDTLVKTGGTLVLGVSSALGQASGEFTSKLEVESGAGVTFANSSIGQTVGQYVGNATSSANKSTLSLNGGTLSIAATGGTGTLTLAQYATINLGTNGTLQVAKGGTVAGDITGSGTLALTNAGTLVLDRAKASLATPVNVTFAGTTSILELNGGSAGNFANQLGGAGILSLANGAPVTLTGNNSTTNAVGGFSGTFDINTGTTLIATEANNLGTATVAIGGSFNVSTTTNWTLGNVLTDDGIDAGLFTKSGSGTLTIAQANTRTGETSVTAGTLKLTNLGGLGSGDIAIASGNSATLQLATAGTLTNEVKDSGTVQVSAATVIIGGTNTDFSGKWLLDSGAVAQVASAGNLGSGHLAGVGTLRVLAATATTPFAFANTASGGNFTGTVQVNQGAFTLTADAAAVLRTSSSVYAMLELGANGSTTLDATNNGLTIGSLTFNGGTLRETLDAGGLATGVLTVENLNAANGGKLAVTLPSSVPATGAGSFFDQDNGILQQIVIANGTVTSGTISLVDASTGAAIPSTSTVKIGDAGDPTAIATYGYTAQVLTSDSTDPVNVGIQKGLVLRNSLTQLDLKTDKELLLANTGIDNELTAKITGTGNLAISAGSGNTVILNNASNDYTGATRVIDGTVLFGSNNALGATSALSLAAATTVDLDGHSQTIGSVSTVVSSILDLNDGTLTITNGGTIAGTLSGAGTALQVNGGTLTISGNNSAGFSAATSIGNGATVKLTHLQGLGTADITLSGTLELAASGNFANNLNGASGQINVTGTGSSVVLTNSVPNTLSTAVSFNVKTGNTLTASSQSNLGSASVAIGGTFVVNTNANWTLVNVLADDANGTDAGLFTKSGTGTLTIAQANNRTGATSITAGTLKLNNIDGVGNGDITIATAGTSTLQVSTAGTLDNVIKGAGIAKISAGTVVVSATNSAFTGQWQLDSGSVAQVTTAGNIGAGQLAGSGTLQIYAATAATPFALASTAAGGSFTGTVKVDRGAFTLNDAAVSVLRTSSSTLATLELGVAGSTTLDTDRTIGNLTFNGGTLNVVMNSDTPAGLLNVSTLAATTGTIAADIPDSHLVPPATIPTGQNSFFDEDQASTGGYRTQVVQADTVLAADGTQLTFSHGGSTAAAVIRNVDNGSGKIGEATYDYAAVIHNTSTEKGVFIEYALTQIASLVSGTNIVLESAGASGATMGAKLTGIGGFEFQADSTVAGGKITLTNGANDYTGATIVSEGTLVFGNSNVLGNTSLLDITNSSTVELNGKTQTVGSLAVDSGSTFNFGTNGTLTLNSGGSSDGTLTGTGSLNIKGDFDVTGANSGLQVTSTIYNGTVTTLDNVQGLGRNGTVVLNGTLTLDGASGSFENVLKNAGTLNLVDSDITLVKDNSDFSGMFAIDSGSTLTASLDEHLGGGALEGDGTFVKTDSATTITISRANSNFSSAATTRITEGGITLENAAGLGSSNIVNSGTLTLAFDGTFANTLSGTGDTIVQDGQTVTLGGNNTAFAGTWSLDGDSVTIIDSAVRLGEGHLTGTGTLQVNLSNPSTAFDFAAGNQQTGKPAFTGTLQLGQSTFTLEGLNQSVIEQAILQLDTGNTTHVGSGEQNVAGLVINGATVIFDATVPPSLVSEGTIHAGTVDLQSGIIKVDSSAINGVINPTIPTHATLLEQDESDIAVLLIKSDTTVAGLGNLKLYDKYTNAQVDPDAETGVMQNNERVANAYYGLHLNTGVNQDGLYVSYGLTKIELLVNGSNALVLTERAGATGAAADLSALVYGSGDLRIHAIDTVSLSNGGNSYTGATYVDQGKLLLNTDSALGNTSLLHLAANTATDINHTTQTVGALNLGQDAQLDVNGGNLTVTGIAETYISYITLGGGTLTLGGGGQLEGHRSLAGNGQINVISSTGDFTDLTILGENAGLHADINIAGLTRVILDSDKSLGDGTVNIANDGTLFFNGNVQGGTQRFALVGDTGAKVVLDAGSSLELVRDNTSFEGTFHLREGSTLTASNASHLGNASVTGAEQDPASLFSAQQLKSSPGFGTLVARADTGADWTFATSVTDSAYSRVGIEKQGEGVLTVGSSAHLDYSGDTTVAAGVLRTSEANVLATRSTHIIQTGALLDLAGHTQTVGGINNAGVISLRSASDTAGTILTVAGDYVANNADSNGYIRLNAELGDDSSVADKLVIQGNSSGTTALMVKDVGSGEGALTKTGIKVVEYISSGTVAHQANFVLAAEDGTIVDGIDTRMYKYALVSGTGSDHDWYLSSAGTSDQGKTILGMSAGMNLNWFLELDSLVKRMGELRISGVPGSQGYEHGIQGWARGYGWQTKADKDVAGVAFTEYYYGGDGGVDKSFRIDESSSLYLGGFFGGGRSKRNFGSSGSGDTDIVHGGLYATYLHDSGWYADLVGKVSNYDSSFDSYSTKGVSSGDFSSWGYGFSLEAGKNMVSQKGWFAEPQVQIAYVHHTGSDYTTTGADPVSINQQRTDSFQLRGGVRFGKNLMTEYGILQPYAKAMVASVWSDGGRVYSDGDSWRANMDGPRMEFGFGANLETNGYGQIYFDYEYIKGQDFEIPWKVNAGYRIQW